MSETGGVVWEAIQFWEVWKSCFGVDILLGDLDVLFHAIHVSPSGSNPKCLKSWYAEHMTSDQFMDAVQI